MIRTLQILRCVLLTTLTALAVYLILLVRAATVTVAAIPGEIAGLRTDLTAILEGTQDDLNIQTTALRKDTLGEVAEIRKTADRQLTAFRSDAMARVDKIESDANTRVGDTLTRVDTALGTVDTLRLNVMPAVTSATALVTDLNASWDDLYWDVKASVESGTVTMHSVAVASEAVAAAAPKLAESGVGIGQSVDGIAADVHQATTDFVKPRTFGQKLKAWLETAGKIAARFI